MQYTVHREQGKAVIHKADCTYAKMRRRTNTQWEGPFEMGEALVAAQSTGLPMDKAVCWLRLALAGTRVRDNVVRARQHEEQRTRHGHTQPRVHGPESR